MASELRIAAKRADGWAKKLAADVQARDDEVVSRLELVAAPTRRQPDRQVFVARHDEPADLAALRKNAQIARAESLALLDAAGDFERCGQDMLEFECFNGHVEHRPFTCGRVALCPDCARVASARQVDAYESRAQELLAKAPASMTPKMLGLPLRPHDSETIGDTFHRTRNAAKRLVQVVWGIPRCKAEWDVYRALWPLSQSELDRIPTVTPGGKARSEATRVRMAWTARRKHVVARRRRDNFGAVVAIEFGERRRNAHAHVFIIGRYVPQKLLSQAWRLCSGGSYIVDIRKVKGPVGKGIRETVKYITKFGGQDPAVLVEMFAETQSYSRDVEGNWRSKTHRRVEALGAMRRQSDDEKDWVRPRMVCQCCGEDQRNVGWIPLSLYRMGVDRAPERFRYRPRGSP